MITVINTVPLPFEQIVTEELAQPLAKNGFSVEPPFHKYKNQEVRFARQREMQKEEIIVQRATYTDEYRRQPPEDDEVESTPIPYDDTLLWVSRHQLSVNFIVDGATNWLQHNGKAGTGEDYWWHFTDEQDLRRLLRELLPMILAAGQQTFDDTLEHNQSEEGKQWQALERRQNEEISRAVRQLGDNYSEEQYKAAVLGVLEQGMELLEKG